MFGENYDSLLASSGALVDSQKELQSAYMCTKLYQFGLTWNLSINSKSVKNQKKLQLQKLFQINLFLHIFSRNLSHHFAIFPVDNSISALIFKSENNCNVTHLSVALRPILGPPVSAMLPPSRHPSPCRSLRAG
jgi:hypothetical protein